MLTHQQFGYILLGFLGIAVLVVIWTYWQLGRINREYEKEQAERIREYREKNYPPNIHLVYEPRVSKLPPWHKTP